MGPRHLQECLLSYSLGKRKNQDHFHFVLGQVASRDYNAYQAFRHHNLHFDLPNFSNFSLVTRLDKNA
jgi:hypothetical protein